MRPARKGFVAVIALVMSISAAAHTPAQDAPTDDPMLEMLEELGYRVTRCGSGQEALNDGPLRTAAMNQPSGIDTDGTVLYFADPEASAIRTADLDPDASVLVPPTVSADRCRAQIWLGVPRTCSSTRNGAKAGIVST